jgi:hypothetical protein
MWKRFADILSEYEYQCRYVVKYFSRENYIDMKSEHPIENWLGFYVNFMIFLKLSQVWCWAYRDLKVLWSRFKKKTCSDKNSGKINLIKGWTPRIFIPNLDSFLKPGP